MYLSLDLTPTGHLTDATAMALQVWKERISLALITHQSCGLSEESRSQCAEVGGCFSFPQCLQPEIHLLLGTAQPRDTNSGFEDFCNNSHHKQQSSKGFYVQKSVSFKVPLPGRVPLCSSQQAFLKIGIS